MAGTTAATLGGTGVACSNAVPQSPQNRLPAAFSVPQVAQRHGNGSPQSPQNFFPRARVAPHRGQFARLTAFGPLTRALSCGATAVDPATA
jgi:hypothetical protein